LVPEQGVGEVVRGHAEQLHRQQHLTAGRRAHRLVDDPHLVQGIVATDFEHAGAIGNHVALLTC
jgi:hypothetical protein